jgi:hypothetical protein
MENQTLELGAFLNAKIQKYSNDLEKCSKIKLDFWNNGAGFNSKEVSELVGKFAFAESCARLIVEKSLLDLINILKSDIQSLNDSTVSKLRTKYLQEANKEMEDNDE